MTAPLFDRLGGETGIRAIANDLVDNHLANPVLAERFAGHAPDRLKNGAATFFIAGSGGPSDAYKGKDMASVHAGMNVNGTEILAAIDDAVDALEKNGIGQREKEEVVFILYSLARDVMAK